MKCQRSETCIAAQNPDWNPTCWDSAGTVQPSEGCWCNLGQDLLERSSRAAALSLKMIWFLFCPTWAEARTPSLVTLASIYSSSRPLLAPDGTKYRRALGTVVILDALTTKFNDCRNFPSLQKMFQPSEVFLGSQIWAVFHFSRLAFRSAIPVSDAEPYAVEKEDGLNSVALLCSYVMEFLGGFWWFWFFCSFFIIARLVPNTLWFTLSDCVPLLLPLATVAVLLT